MVFKKKYCLLAVIFLSLQYMESASAAIFKCTTVDGETIYSSKKCEGNTELFIPKKEINVQQIKISENDLNKPSVDIYVTSWCPYCKKAIAYLRSKNIAFNIYDIGEDVKAKVRKRKMAPGYMGIPLTVINGEIIKGFSPGRFDKALNL